MIRKIVFVKHPAKILKAAVFSLFFTVIVTFTFATNRESAHVSYSPYPEIIKYAKQWLGVKYKYGAAHPNQGFDCSGFVHYVYKQFNISIPRSSAAIGKVGKTIRLEDAEAGDIILFTGTNPRNRQIGHVGIVVSNDGIHTKFIHASSGKAMAVTETPLEGSYKKRFIKVIRVAS
ncbi:C40 family peptidase [Olivibacter sitiensis]|uniref:C40 family peptidase n=1 Tax=Olivibacter sitiensis TaxID=376470 RepID=UPI0004184B27|nr:C40 family peptidase [Olivibacter sitiensis]